MNVDLPTGTAAASTGYHAGQYNAIATQRHVYITARTCARVGVQERKVAQQAAQPARKELHLRGGRRAVDTKAQGAPHSVASRHGRCATNAVYSRHE